MNLTSFKFMPLLILPIVCCTSLIAPVSYVQDASVLDRQVGDVNNDMQFDRGDASDVNTAEESDVVDHTAEFVDYIFSAMTEWIPVKEQCYWDANQKKYQNCLDAATEHYQSIARTIVDGIIVPDRELPFSDDNAIVKSALVMAAIAATEGHYYNNVDTCKKKGDGGLAIGLWQTHVSGRVRRLEICHNRSKALDLAIQYVNQSFNACKRYPLRDRLSVYTTGTCHKNWWPSHWKMDKALRYYNLHPFAFKQ